jgi:hypothetical protein
MKPRPRSGSLRRVSASDILTRLLSRRRAPEEQAFTLFLPPASEAARLFRDGNPLRAADLLDPLAALGYQVELARADGRALGADDALDGKLELRDGRLGNGHLAIECFTGAPGANGVASLEAVKDRRGRYVELAKFLIVALSKRLPGLQYKATYSSLFPDDPALLAATLPDRPDL